jgi:hypothetical protein
MQKEFDNLIIIKLSNSIYNLKNPNSDNVFNYEL